MGSEVAKIEIDKFRHFNDIWDASLPPMPCLILFYSIFYNIYRFCNHMYYSVVEIYEELIKHDSFAIISVPKFIKFTSLKMLHNFYPIDFKFWYKRARWEGLKDGILILKF